MPKPSKDHKTALLGAMVRQGILMLPQGVHDRPLRGPANAAACSQWRAPAPPGKVSMGELAECVYERRSPRNCAVVPSWLEFGPIMPRASKQASEQASEQASKEASKTRHSIAQTHVMWPHIGWIS